MSNKALKIILACILILIIIGLTTFLIFALKYPNSKMVKFGINNKSELLITKEYNSIDIEKIVTTSRSADIRVALSNDESFSVKIYGDKDSNPTVEVNNKELQIDYDYKTFCFGFCGFVDSIIEIYLPSSFIGDLNLTTVSGDIKTTNISSDNIFLKSTSGDLWVEKTKNANLNTVSGDVKVASSNNLSVKTISGDIEINTITNSLKAETVSGEVEINNLTINTNSSIQTTSGDIEIKNSNDIYVETSTKSGDNDVMKNNRYSDITLKISSISGDIEVR